MMTPPLALASSVVTTALRHRVTIEEVTTLPYEALTCAVFLTNRAFLSEYPHSHLPVHDCAERDFNELLWKGEPRNTNDIARKLRKIGAVDFFSDFRGRAEGGIDVQYVKCLFNHVIEGRAELL